MKEIPDLQPNVLLLTVDSLRADHVGSLGYERNTTPFLDSLGEQATIFTDAYAASVHTRESIPSILTGMYASDAVTRTYRLRRDTIAASLSDAGYRTGAFLASPFFTREFGYGPGFDVFDSHYSTSLPSMVAKYLVEIVSNEHFRDGYDVNDELLEFVRTGSRPYFAWAHYMDVHGPYNRFDTCHFGTPMDSRRLQLLYRRAKYLPSTISEKERQLLVDHYDNGIRHFDSILSELFDELAGVGALENTLVIVVADHGESFGENGMYEHKRHLGNELLHVPLIVDGIDRTGRVTEPVSTVDVFATIAEKAGIRTDRDSASLVATSRESAIRASCLNFFRRQGKTITSD